MPLSPSERIQVLVRCDHCGKATEKFLSGLINKATIACKCGSAIDLKSADNAALIEKLAEQLPSLDATFAKIGR